MCKITVLLVYMLLTIYRLLIVLLNSSGPAGPKHVRDLSKTIRGHLPQKRCILLSSIPYIFCKSLMYKMLPIPVTARSIAWVFGCSLVGNAASNPAGGMVVSCGCCLLSGTGLCVGLNTHPENFYQM
jgi:hypothetical protein